MAFIISVSTFLDLVANIAWLLRENLTVDGYSTSYRAKAD